jgi:histidyl-tRNA synthetase
MGMGDCVLEILLRERGILEKQLRKEKLFCFVACADESYRDTAIQTTMKIRSSGFSANFSYKVTKLGKQLKQASEQNAKKCVIIGDEFKDKKLIVKDMASGEQKLVDYDEFLSGLKP